jgi:hypothetical protein
MPPQRFAPFVELIRIPSFGAEVWGFQTYMSIYKSPHDIVDVFREANMESLSGE